MLTDAVHKIASEGVGVAVVTLGTAGVSLVVYFAVAGVLEAFVRLLDVAERRRGRL